MNIPASALSMCLVTGLAPLCVASTIYVDGTGLTGDTMTIQAAVDLAVSGDTIEIEEGIYVDDDGDGVIAHIDNKELTIRSADGGVTLDGQGAARGFLIDDSTVYLYQLDLLDCAALDGEGGGGVWYESSGENLWVISCTFTDCSAPIEFDNGGALHIVGDGSSSAYYEVDDCTFTSCTSASYGGALYVYDADGLIMHSAFTGCSSGNGGACEFRDGEADIYQCTFDNNTANNGGAIRIYTSDADIEIGESSFTGNQSTTGAAICQNRGDLAIYDSDIIDNVASFAGAIWLRDNDPAAIIDVANCRFAGNETTSSNSMAGIGGNLIINLTVTDSTFCDHPWEGDIEMAYTDGGGNELGQWCCPGDVDEDGDVDVDDLAALVTGYGDELLDADDREDCTRDGSVDVVDLMGMLGQWGACSE